MSVLYPPILESQRNSVPSHKPTAPEINFTIPITLPLSVDPSAVRKGHIQVLVRRQIDMLPWVHPDMVSIPEKEVVFLPGSALSEDGHQIVVPSGLLRPFIAGDSITSPVNEQTGRMYTLQVRFGDSPLWVGDMTKFAAWKAIQVANSLFGEWSNTQRIFCYGVPTSGEIFNVSIASDIVGKLHWGYNPVSQDPISQVRLSYGWSVPDSIGNHFVAKDIGFEITNTSTGASSNSVDLNIMRLTDITATLILTTINGSKFEWSGKILAVNNPSVAADFPVDTLPGNQISSYPIVGEELEDGVLAKSFSGVFSRRAAISSTEEVYYNIYRVDVMNLETVLLSTINGAVDSSFAEVVRDYSIEMGAEYAYVAASYGKVTQRLHYLLTRLTGMLPSSWNPLTYSGYGRQMNFNNNLFLTTRFQQLRLQGNLSVNSFQRNTSDQLTTTIGSKYPTYSRSAAVNYRSFSLQALLSLNFDTTHTFLKFKTQEGDLIKKAKSRIAEDYRSAARALPKDNDYKKNLLALQDKYYAQLKLIYSGVNPEPVPAGEPKFLSTNWTDGQLWFGADGVDEIAIRATDLFSREEHSLNRKRIRSAANPLKETIDSLDDLDEYIFEEDRLIETTDRIRGATTVFDERLGIDTTFVNNSDRTDEIIYSERKFREAAMSWLSNGKPKLFRSETEGNMIVVLTGIVFSPLDKSRQVYSLSATVTEVAEYNLQNLILYGLVPVDFKPFSIPGSEYDFVPGSPDKNIDGWVDSFSISINSGDDRVFYLPTRGELNSGSGAPNYNVGMINWKIEWGDGSVEKVEWRLRNWEGIRHLYQDANTDYKIVISPLNPEERGWLSLFGCGAYGGIGNINKEDLANRYKIILVDGPLTEKAIAKSKLDTNVCQGMFFACQNPRFTMGEFFSLPQDIGEAKSFFCKSMFEYCDGESFTMGRAFNLPQKISDAGDYFCNRMFKNCSGATFNMSGIFNLPENLSEIGVWFCENMFNNCFGESFTMNSVFNISPKIDYGTYGFCSSMFEQCSGASFTMNSVFNLPSKINLSTGRFCAAMFKNCSGVAFDMNSIFKLPSAPISDSVNFCSEIFCGCSTAKFLNLIGFFNGKRNFDLGKDAFWRAFNGCGGYRGAPLTASKLIMLRLTPPSNNECFTGLPESISRKIPILWGGTFDPAKEGPISISVYSDYNKRFYIPTNGSLNNITTHNINWIIDWGDGTKEVVTKMQDTSGIRHDYPKVNTIYEIVIFPKDPLEEGWFKAFGCGMEITDQSGQALRNRTQIRAVNGKLTECAISVSSTDDNICAGMFYYCSGLTTIMGSDFNLPQEITEVGNNFCKSMFERCEGADFTMNSTFNIPQKIVSVGDGFCQSMFDYCSKWSFNMNSIFNIPPGIIKAGDDFCRRLFYHVSNHYFTMNSIFNIPQNIIEVGNGFCDNMFSACRGTSFTMNPIFNIPQNIVKAGNRFCSGIFDNCSNLTMNSIFNIPQNIIEVGSNFCQTMFYLCDASQFTMNPIFNIPQNIVKVGNNFCKNMFSTCRGSRFTMNPIFNIPQEIVAIEDGFCDNMFSECNGNTFTMNSIFNIPQKIIDAKGNFCTAMFSGCRGKSFNMNSIFNIPPEIATLGDRFCQNMFDRCYGATFTMNNIFNLPRKITTVGRYFCSYMFDNCSGAAFNMNPIFNLPQKITKVGDYFCGDMFSECPGVAFNMNAIFNLPQGTTIVGDDFCQDMFNQCRGAAFNMNAIFNLPQKITNVGNNFCIGMFRDCRGATFNMNSILNLPQGITEVGSNFCKMMFAGCSGELFDMNSAFKIPSSLIAVSPESFAYIFNDCIKAKLLNLVNFFNNKTFLLSNSEAFSYSFNKCRGYAGVILDINILPILQSSPTENNQCFFDFPESSRVNIPIKWGGLLAPPPEESFSISVDSGSNKTFYIPTNGKLNGITSHTIKWAIDWGDGTKEVVTKIQDASGIKHIYPNANTDYQIIISPNDPYEEGWLRAFGCGTEITSQTGQNQANRDKIILVNGQLSKTSLIYKGSADYACGAMFYSCQNPRFTMGDDFTLPKEFREAGNNFCGDMFANCSGAAFNMNSIFNLPQDIAQIGNDFCRSMFFNCSGAGFTMNSIFNLPQENTTVGTGFCSQMFGKCLGTAFSMGDAFNLPQNIVQAGVGFCNNMFDSCSGAAFNMNSVFNLPQEITTVGADFGKAMFVNCSGAAFTMNSVFNIPQKITVAAENFCKSIFANCSGAAFIMNLVFNLPPGIIKGENDFCESMFFNCSGMAFAMNSVFNLPSGMDRIALNFCAQMFSNCSNETFTMNSIFNLPLGIKSTQESFCEGMFANCSGSAFNMNSIFNLPQGVSWPYERFCAAMFKNCSGVAFDMNSIFKVPPSGAKYNPICQEIFSGCSKAKFLNLIGFFNTGSYISSGAFYRAFSNCVGYAGPILSPSNLSILGLIPRSGNECFVGFPESSRANIPIKWGGSFIPFVEGALSISVDSGSDKTFYIPTNGNLDNSSSHTINWAIDWGDGTQEVVTKAQDTDGIKHIYPNANTDYQITISANDPSEGGWLRAFGCGTGITSQTGQSQANRDKIILVNGQLSKASLIYDAAPPFANAWGAMFYSCQNPRFTMGDNFTLPKEFREAGNGLCRYMFANCSGAAFTMNSIFNLPQDVGQIGDTFCRDMFANCSGAAFTMNSIFNLPQNVGQIGGLGFCNNMFGNCSGAAFTMNSIFNLPQDITVVGNSFCSTMFKNCSGEGFDMNSVFKIPSALTQISNYSFSAIFSGCLKAKFLNLINFFNNKEYPYLGPDPFREAFNNCSGYSGEVLSSSNLPILRSIPSSNNKCFFGFPETSRVNIPVNWGGTLA